jgi:hypothetical protein
MHGDAKPIRSLHEDDADLEDALDAFILGLGETLDDLQDAVMSQSWNQLVVLTEAVVANAQKLGYPALIEVLREIQIAAENDDSEGARKSVGELTELAQLVRRGHHTAA